MKRATVRVYARWIWSFPFFPWNLYPEERRALAVLMILFIPIAIRAWLAFHLVIP